VNLGLNSEFTEINHLCHRLYGSEYDTDEIRRHHHDDVHEYLISRTVLDADVVISLPKLKTHKKTGITVNLKNLVGINGDKNWLPHHREGTPSQGGDQFADDALLHRLEQGVMAGFRRVFPRLAPAIGDRRAGQVAGKTAFRRHEQRHHSLRQLVRQRHHLADGARSQSDPALCRCRGRLHDRPVRRFFSIVDGIIAGEGNGPLDPTPKLAGHVIAGFNPIAVDLACAHRMGFSYRRLPLLCRATKDHPLAIAMLDPADVVSQSNDARFAGRLVDLDGACLPSSHTLGGKGILSSPRKDEAGVVT